MKTFIYMIRHGESPKTEGNDRTRGLTDKGRLDSRKDCNRDSWSRYDHDDGAL
jgi:phosphohistidine phosphatase SixA